MLAFLCYILYIGDVNRYNYKEDRGIVDKMLVVNGERVDNLDVKGLKIIQNPQEFCFGMDAVLLSWFASRGIKKNNYIIDLGTGTGIIPLLIWAKSQPIKIDAIEIQEQMVDMARRSMKLNKLEEKIEIFNGDIKKLPDNILSNFYDVVVTNPPYMNNQGGLINPKLSKAIARHEILCNLEEIIETSKKLLKSKGKFYMVHRPNRLVDIMYYMRKNKIEPKSMRLIYPQMGKKPNMVLIEGIKGGNPMLNILEPLFVYDKDGEYTEEIFKIYGFRQNS